MPYLPPTMSPAGASKEAGYLEHPGEVFAAYRAVVVLTREAARFGAPERWPGTVYARTGRPFFRPLLEAEFLARLNSAADGSAKAECRRLCGSIPTVQCALQRPR